MENTRPILYGVADYAQIRKKNGWFIDRTAKIRDLEATAYAMFLRPRRFGKSLLISMLHAYYDVNFADRFEEFFGGTDIGANPTDELGLPNGTLRQIAAQMFTQAYSDACGIDQRTSAINAGLRAFAAKGTWDKLLEPLFDVVKQNFAVRDAKEGETAVASAISALLIAAGGPYYIKREREANGGFYDLSMSPRFDIAPKIEKKKKM